jgi:type II secretory pathway pseudopilin PulG
MSRRHTSRHTASGGQVARFPQTFRGAQNGLLMMWFSSGNDTGGGRNGQARTIASPQGFSLVEVIVMLSVVSILVGSIVPAVWDSVSTAREIRAKNDVTQIASAVVNFQRDLGLGAFVRNGRAWGADTDARDFVQVLVSRGDAPRATSPGAAAWIDKASDLLEEHLLFNARAYPMLKAGLGIAWRGPYLSMPLDADPWGTEYLVNNSCLVPAAQRGMTDDCAVFVISAGPNRTIDTPFMQPVVRASVFGDDIAVRIQ